MPKKGNYGHKQTKETREKLRAASIKQFKCRPYESAFNTLLLNVKRRGLTCDLSYADYLAFTSILICSYCGAAVQWAERNTHKNQRQNLDRKDNTQGYIKKNLVVCCWRCNNIKGDHFTFEQFLEIGKLIRSWGFSGSVKDYPSYLNCPYCPSQSYLQKTSRIPRFNEYKCISKHISYVEKESDEQSKRNTVAI